MRKRLFAALLCTIMTMALLPVATQASNPVDETPPVTIGGVPLTAENCYYVNGGDGKPGSVSGDNDGNWNAYYHDHTLELNNLALIDYNGNGVNVEITGNGVFALELTGTNTVSTASGSNAHAVSIKAVGGVTIQANDEGSLDATANGGGDGINISQGATINSGTVTGTAKGAGHGVKVGTNLIIKGGSLNGVAKGNGNGVNVGTTSISYDEPNGSVRGTSANGYGVSAPEVKFAQFGTLTASGGYGATSGTAIEISPYPKSPTNDPDWCSVTTSADKNGSNSDVNLGSEAAVGTEHPITYTPDANTKYLRIAPVVATDELVLTDTKTDNAAATDSYTYDLAERKLTINNSGSYTLSMADGVEKTTHQVEITVGGVELTLNNVNIEAVAGAAALKSSGSVEGNTILLIGDNTLKAGGDASGLEAGGKLTIDGTGSLTAISVGEGAGIGISDSADNMDLTIEGGKINAYNKSLESTAGPGIGSNILCSNLMQQKSISVTVTGGEVQAEGRGGIATSTEADANTVAAVITVTISGGKVTGVGDEGCGIGGCGARVVISGGVVEGRATADTTEAAPAGIGGMRIISVIGETRNIRDDAGVFISGGVVTAAGASNKTNHGGAGIGGLIIAKDKNSYSTVVEISGGDVTATGGYGAAGIGGSSVDIMSSGGLAEVTITGGNVTAAGGTGGRAIGGGNGERNVDKPDTSTVKIIPNEGEAMMLKFADALNPDWSSVTDSVAVINTHDYKKNAHYDKLCARISQAYAVSGTVKDATGAPVEGATVTAGGRSATTDDDGVYTLWLENGNHTITAEKGKLRCTLGVTVDGAALSEQNIVSAPASAPVPINIPTHAPSDTTAAPASENGEDGDTTAGDIWLTGGDFPHDERLIIERNPSGDAYDALLRLADGDDVFSTYDICLTSGRKSTDSAVYLTFDLDAKYAEQAFTLVHQKADATYEYFYATADANGDLTFGPLYELSPFMLVKGTLTQAPDADVIDIPKTGDDPTPALWLCAMLTASAVAAAGFAVYRKRQSN